MLFLQKSFVIFSAYVAFSNAWDHGAWSESTITYYTPSGGKCGYDATPLSKNTYNSAGKKFVAALSEDFMRNGLGGGPVRCGECFEVRCTGKINPNAHCGGCKAGKSVVVQIVDQCSKGDAHCGGPKPHFDLSPEAFDEIAHRDCGLTRVEFRPVKCQNSGTVNGNLEIKVKPDSDVNNMAIYTTNVGGPGNVREMWVRDLNPLHRLTCKWIKMPYNENNEFKYSKIDTGMGRLYGPFSFKMENSFGEVITTHNVHPSVVTAKTIMGADTQTAYPRARMIDIGANFGNGDVTVGTDPCGNPELANIKLNIKPDSHGWWTAIYVSNTRNSGQVTKMYIRDEDERQKNYCKWQELQDGNDGKYSEFQFTKSGGNNRLYGPLSVKLVSDAGELISYGIIDASDVAGYFRLDNHLKLIDFGTNFGSAATVGVDHCNPDAKKEDAQKQEEKKVEEKEEEEKVEEKKEEEKVEEEKKVEEKKEEEKKVEEKKVEEKKVEEPEVKLFAEPWQKCDGLNGDGSPFGRRECVDGGCCKFESKWFSMCWTPQYCSRRRLMAAQDLE